ncbi:hypothetical protein HOE22_12640 [Candidatus Woesearchaeota archaeon]|jgi:hypothetical protein|nr:hypothetical protein [Bacteroidota bacterium]MBT4209169.1 hypothetical protein [Candidatus Woesearchaeota archaeon]MBT5528044.1 hypothetical protein [Cytophagia bacterium]MBT7040753.1 hypothetical protein [Bacteroidota bacterium]MBT7827893.1 hypothetical protein [Bacteroidota bacterium]
MTQLQYQYNSEGEFIIFRNINSPISFQSDDLTHLPKILSTFVNDPNSPIVFSRIKYGDFKIEPFKKKIRLKASEKSMTCEVDDLRNILNFIKETDPPSPIEQSSTQLANLNIPGHLLANLNMQEVVNKMTIAFKKMDQVKGSVKKLEDAGFLKKFWYNIKGETKNVLLDSQKAQIELAKFQTFLLLLNTYFSKELKRQQDLIVEQNEKIQDSNDRIEKQNTTILGLVHLTDKQEKDIRDIVSEAAYMQKIDEKLSKELKKMSSEIQELKKENSKYNKKIESKIKDTNLNAEKSKNYYNGKITDQENSVNKLITEAKSFSKSIKSVKDSLVKNSDGLRDEFSGKFDGIIESLSIKINNDKSLLLKKYLFQRKLFVYSTGLLSIVQILVILYLVIY